MARAATGWEALRVWESEQGVVPPEPYRTSVAETANGSPLGPPGDGGLLLPLGRLPPGWPDQGQPRDPAAGDVGGHVEHAGQRLDEFDLVIQELDVGCPASGVHPGRADAHRDLPPPRGRRDHRRL